MFLTIANIAFFLIAVAMIVLILLQRGQGAAAGSGFGAGASATVFGARGSSNFLSRATAVLATLFMIVSLGMAVYASRQATGGAGDDLGVMGALSTPAEVPQPAQQPGAGEVPLAPPPASEIPVDDVPPADAGVVEVDPQPEPEADDRS
jgi:preprotein translocase subunit SecG